MCILLLRAARAEQDAKHGFRFGSGLYFAEDIGKSLSYATCLHCCLTHLLLAWMLPWIASSMPCKSCKLVPGSSRRSCSRCVLHQFPCSSPRLPWRRGQTVEASRSLCPLLAAAFSHATSWYERLPVSLRLLCRVLCGQMHYTEGQVDGSASANAKQVGQAECRPCPNVDRTQLRHDAKPNLGKSHDLMQMNAVGRKMLTSQVGKHAVLANPLAEGPREFIVLTEMQAECFPPSHRAKIPVAARSTPSTWWRCLCPRRRALEAGALGGHVAAT